MLHFKIQIMRKETSTPLWNHVWGILPSKWEACLSETLSHSVRNLWWLAPFPPPTSIPSDVGFSFFSENLEGHMLHISCGLQFPFCCTTWSNFISALDDSCWTHCTSHWPFIIPALALLQGEWRAARGATCESTLPRAGGSRSLLSPFWKRGHVRPTTLPCVPRAIHWGQRLGWSTVEMEH